MKQAPIGQVINHYLAQLEEKWAQISKNVTERTRTELTTVIETLKKLVPTEPGIAFLVANNNFGKFYALIEGAEEGKYAMHTTADMLSHYMRLAANINDQYRGRDTGYI